MVLRSPNSPLTSSNRAIPSLITRAHVSGEFFVAHYYQPKKIGSLSDYYATEEFIVGSSGIATTMGMDVEPAFNGKKMWFDRNRAKRPTPGPLVLVHPTR
ncbi:hypothetical protein ACN38_g10408 [Penicillium nordicum]|uniref:Peptidase S12 Pab87-related C-terminal domain-containing protein n=1 Tax=Penicillium nordicum TaxID=229535 RepID=A0A0M9WBQ7_9EURO|nr:hypothetical protein ACN38_g10408 [Penicillium nordicum]